MEHLEKNLESFREHHKTQFLMTQYDATAEKLAEVEELLEDPEMADLAAGELVELKEQLDNQYREMERIIESSKEEDAKPYGVVLEVRAGAGGDEAALFAEELAQMYLRFAETRGWETSKDYESPAMVGGYKEAAFQILGNEVYDALRFETGVHRVQRIPAT